MNPILLSNWLEICTLAKVNYIPAIYGPSVNIDEIHRFNQGLGNVLTLDKAYQWLRRNYKPRGHIGRWDCCSTETLKSAMADGYSETPPLLQFDLDDLRFMAVIEELENREEKTVSVLLRPWILAKVEDKYPVEFRAFVFPEGIAVSNYHTRRPLPISYHATALQVRSLTEKLANHTPIDTFTADFILTKEGEILFLEAGLGFKSGGLVNPCCFDSHLTPGAIALHKISVKSNTKSGKTSSPSN